MAAVSKRIAFFVPDLEGGGAERVIVDLANVLSTEFQVDLVAQRATGPYLSEVRERVRIVDLKAGRLISSVFPLMRYFRKTRPAATLCTPAAANVVAVVAWAAAGRPGRLIVREAITPSVDDACNTGVRARLVAIMRRLAYRFANHVVAPSEGVAEDLIRNNGVAQSRVSVIANPADLARIRALMYETVDSVSLPPDAPVILGVGRLSVQKDFGTLIRAFSMIAHDRDAVLLLLGEGEERERLRALVAEHGLSDRVFMPGFVENPFWFMKRAAVFVLSSRYEGFPNALLQALLVGTPVIATDCPSGPREILENGRWGRLVPVGDANTMSKAILDALDGRVVIAPTAVISDRYGAAGVAKQYLHVLLPDAGAPARREVEGDVTKGAFPMRADG